MTRPEDQYVRQSNISRYTETRFVVGSTHMKHVGLSVRLPPSDVGVTAHAGVPS